MVLGGALKREHKGGGGEERTTHRTKQEGGRDFRRRKLFPSGKAYTSKKKRGDSTIFNTLERGRICVIEIELTKTRKERVQHERRRSTRRCGDHP